MDDPPGRRQVRSRTRPSVTGASDLARRIEAAHQAAVDAAHNAIERASACGRLLLQAKGRVGHGNWLAWLVAHTTITPRTAQRYMRIYQYRELLSADPTRVTHLSVRAAVAMISTPRATPAQPPSDPAVPAAPAARAAAPAPRSQTRPAPQPAPDPEPDHLARLQAALDGIMELPEPAVLAQHMIRRDQVDTLRPSVVQVSQYLNLLGIELRRHR